MASTSRLRAAVLLVAGMLAPGPATSAAPALPGEAAPPPHRIAVDVRGPLAVVQVTRVLPLEGDSRDGGEALLDVALPDGAALIDIEVQEGGRFHAVDTIEAARGRDLYLDGMKERDLTAASEPFDDSTTFRLRVARAVPLGTRPASSVTVRYRFSALASFGDGRHRLRFPAAPERQPSPADVTVALPAGAAADVEIAGARTALAADARGAAQGHASTRSGWEISWAPRAATTAEGGPSLEATAVAAAIAPAESALAFSVRGRGARSVAPPPNVLFLVDRSRSVGLPGLSAERDLVRRLLETLPPTTRFDTLFFDRAVKRLFPMARPATREAMAALEAEMVPDQLQNGTDIAAALREAGALLRREASTFAPRTLLAVVTDGALGDDEDGAALDRALGALPGLDLSIAAFTVRIPEDDPVAPGPRRALAALAGARGGLFRELRTNEVEEGAPAALAVLEQGGDVAGVHVLAPQDHPLAEGLAPGQAVAGVMRLPTKTPRAASVEGTVRGQRVKLPLRPQPVDAAWLRPLLGGAAPTRFLGSASTVALVEPVLRPEPAREAPVKGSMDRMVVRNALSLAYLPRARACYLGRSGATPALRDLSGRVRIAIDLVRGEVARAKVESSTLNHPEIETCLHEGAFAFEVPRAIHSDAPVTAVLNLVFRPSTPDKKHDAHEIDGALGDQIDLIIEELHRSEQAASAAPPRPAKPAP
jgi:hypothetical protein